MNILNFKSLMSISDYASIELVFLEAVRLKIIKIDDLPQIPNVVDRPVLVSLINEINNGKISDRVKKYSITVSAKNKMNVLFELEDRRKFIELTSKNLSKDFTYTYCRATKIWIEDEFVNHIKESEKIYLYANFDSFDLKIGTDLKEKMVLLKHCEMELVLAEYSKIHKWNLAISKINNTVSRLNHIISEYKGAKC